MPSLIPSKIAELKTQLNGSTHIPEALPTPRPAEYRGPELLFGQNLHATREEIMAGLPPKAEADQLIIAYFGSMDMAPGLVFILYTIRKTADKAQFSCTDLLFFEP